MDEWLELLPHGYRLEIENSDDPEKYVLYRAGQVFEGKPVGHGFTSLARAVCYAHYLNGAIGHVEEIVY